MKVTIVGSGDAFGSGARAHTCFRVDAGGACLLVDFGASALLGWKRLGFRTDEIDGIVISHLHGDHFGGLPFLLLEAQYVAQRRRPLVLAGPPGFESRLEMAMEAFFPGSTATRWGFPWRAMEISPREPAILHGFEIETFEVIHPSGAPPTAVRIACGEKVFVYSGDSGWTDTLIAASRGADLFIVECYSDDREVPNHIAWPTLKRRLREFDARRIALTHMSEGALALEAEMRAAGCTPLADGMVLDV